MAHAYCMLGGHRRQYGACVLHAGWPQTTIWRMRIACWVAIDDIMAHAYFMLGGHRRQYGACALTVD